MMPTELDTLVGTEIDGYRIEKPIGEGGIARVYRAYDIRLARYVAIRVVEPLWAVIDSDYTSCFEKEARTLAQLQHPHIVTIYHFGKVTNLHYMVMQYIEGVDLAWILADYASRSERMPYADVQRIVNQIASALDYVHSKGVIHRDVQPANMTLDQEGNAFLSNFGLALAQTEDTYEETFGTPYYVAPEQTMSSAAAVPQSDQYSLGVMIFEMLTGKVPFQYDSPVDVAMAHVNKFPPSPLQYNRELHPGFVTVLGRALEKKPQDRYPTCSALAADLERILRLQMQQPSVKTHLSELSVSDEVEVFRAANPITLPLTIPIATPEVQSEAGSTIPHQPERRRWKWGEIAAAVMVGIIVAVTAFFVLTLLRSAASPPLSVTPVSSPVPVSTIGMVLATPVPATPVSLAATPAPAGWLPVRFIYDQDAFYWLNDSGETISTAAIVFERVGGSEHFEGYRFAYSFMEPGRCMQIMFADVAVIGCPENRRPNAYFTPTHTQGIDFWTGSGQFRVLWNGVEIAVCDISAGQCNAYIPNE